MSFSEELRDSVVESGERDGIAWGVWAGVIEDGVITRNVAYENGEGRFYAASLNKLLISNALMAAQEKGHVALEGALEIEPHHKIEGSGILRRYPNGYTVQIRDLERLMICISDNTAAYMLVELLGVGQVNEIASHLRAPEGKLEDLRGEGKLFTFGETSPFAAAAQAANLLKDPLRHELLFTSRGYWGMRYDIDRPSLLAVKEYEQKIDAVMALKLEGSTGRERLIREAQGTRNAIGIKDGDYEDGDEGVGWHHEAGVFPISASRFLVVSALSEGRLTTPEKRKNPAVKTLRRIGSLAHEYAKTL